MNDILILVGIVAGWPTNPPPRSTASAGDKSWNCSRGSRTNTAPA